MLKKIKFWLPFAVISTIICGLIYLSVQQVIRQSANDPQIQMAEDVLADFKKGQNNQNLISSYKQIDMADSLSPFIIIYDEKAKPIESSASLGGRIPSPPSGVFDFVRIKNKNVFTWEPKKGIRIAAVVMRYGNGFILTGRSLREVEKREDQLVREVSVAWIACLFSTFLLVLLLS